MISASQLCEIVPGQIVPGDVPGQIEPGETPTHTPVLVNSTFAVADGATGDCTSAVAGGDRLVRVAEGHARICAALEDWALQQKRAAEDWALQQKRAAEAHAEQLAEHERLAGVLLAAHREALLEIQQLAGSSAAAKTSNGLPTMPAQKPPDINVAVGGSGAVELSEGGGGTGLDLKVPAPGMTHDAAPDPKATAPDAEEDLAAQMDALGMDDQMLDHWRRTSGLHTVDKWVSNYQKHPAGWAVMLMIHGIPEVTGRLRSKVENYSIYSALFLSMSMAMLCDPPDAITSLQDAELWSLDWWNGPFLGRIYFYGFAIGTASHMLSILLGMSFVNALNETARDSDVYRMFSRGKAFIATTKCQKSFRLGCVADFVAVAAAMYSFLTIVEVLLGGLILLCVTGRIFKITAEPLFKSGSIVAYWREELGGHPDKDDPYDLQIPIGCFQERVKLNRNLLLQAPAAAPSVGACGGGSASSAAALWREWRNGAPGSDESGDGHRHNELQHRPVQDRVAVAALF